nr:unnamed protein product [Spirometra erinaceieuropaei]
MADVLSLLREYHLNNKPIIENRDEIIFGEFAWPKTTKTNYIIWGTGKDGTAKDYYTLDCIVYLLKNIELPHSQYVRQAATAQVPVVRFPDRRELLAYLKGETNLAPNIDRTVPIDISVRRPVSKSSGDLQAIRRGEHIDKDAKIEAKRPRMSSYEPTDPSATASLGTGESGQTEKSDEPKMDSSSVQGSTFQAKGSALPKAMPLDKIQSLRANARVADTRLLARPKPRASRVPIIIIPAAPTSLITMLNAQDILQDLRFVTTEDKRSQGCKRENELLIHRQKADGRTVPYRVIDQPNKLQPDEWNRVVAVFVQGQAWQFKGWPIGSDPAVIFSLLKGFHLKYANMPLDANVAKWNVQVINLDRRRHLDKVHFQGVWDQLDKHIAKYKSFLRS